MRLLEGRWSPKSKVTLTIDYGDERVASAVAEAVSPDNFEAPEDIRIESVARGGHVLAVIEGTSSLERVVSTIEDLLSCIQAAERAIGAVRGEKDKSRGPSNNSEPLGRP